MSHHAPSDTCIACGGLMGAWGPLPRSVGPDVVIYPVGRECSHCSIVEWQDDAPTRLNDSLDQEVA